jgi:hypothetical protein
MISDFHEVAAALFKQSMSTSAEPSLGTEAGYNTATTAILKNFYPRFGACLSMAENIWARKR